MFYRVLGSIAFIFIGLSYLGTGIPVEFTGIVAIAAGIALALGV